MSEALLTVVVPVYEDDNALARLLDLLSRWRLPVVVVDGAASAATEQLANSFAATYLSSAPGRGGQIARGVEVAASPWVWVLHADSQPSVAAYERLKVIVKTNDCCWGRFNVRLEGFALIAFLMNWRSRLSRICTGDQGMFFSLSALEQIGGFPPQPLMEDIEVSRQLKRSSGHFLALPELIHASPRRWRERGLLVTVVSMWWYRLRYFAGADAADLYMRYYGKQ
jgi:rSAM/selenodomain-associated transferase 2